ncbi:hypothetical protein VTG60DRAFT_4536 [Thermothelomyces hinnuleus]
MCSFILQRSVCKDCRTPLEVDRVDHLPCECSKCVLEEMEAEELARQEEEEEEEEEEEQELMKNGKLDSGSSAEESGSPPIRAMQLGDWMD